MKHATLALVVSLVVTAALYPAFLTVLVRMRAGQRIQAYGPSSHGVKAGTPTMGGLLFCAVVAITALLIDGNRAGFVAVFALVAGAGLGLVDDIANVRGRGALGLIGRQKLIVQTVIGVLVGIGLHAIGATHQVVPFAGAPDLGWAIVPIAAFAVVAASNAVNLTDGVDGLAGTCTAVAFAGLLIIALHVHALAAAVVSAAVIGAMVAFVIFNWHPARVFMGDTGALALGCALVAVACEVRLLWLLPLLGFVFVAETLSVIINVTAIRRFHRRIFRASPIHHHFEALGIREARLVLGFGAVAVIAAGLTVIWAYHLPGLMP